MAKIIIHFVIVAATFLLLANVVPGFHVAGWGSALLAALVFGLVNAILLIVVAFIVPGFSFNGFGPALIGSIVLAAVNLLWKAATRDRHRVD